MLRIEEAEDHQHDDDESPKRPYVVAISSSSMKSNMTSKRPSKNSKAWRKPKDMPRRPLSAYNLFFRSERRRLLADPLAEASTPAESVIRRPRLGFAELARTVARSWHQLDDEAKIHFQKQARTDKIRYKKELKIWNKSFETNNESDDDDDDERCTDQSNHHTYQAPQEEQQHPSNVDPNNEPSSSSPAYYRMAQLLNQQQLNAQAQRIGNQQLIVPSVPQTTTLTCFDGAFLQQSLGNRQVMQGDDGSAPSSNTPSGARATMMLSWNNNFLPPSEQREKATPTALRLYHEALAASITTVARHPSEPDTPHVSIQSWLDLASDLLTVPCDVCNSPSEHEGRIHSPEMSVDGDFVAMLKEADSTSSDEAGGAH